MSAYNIGFYEDLTKHYLSTIIKYHQIPTLSLPLTTTTQLRHFLPIFYTKCSHRSGHEVIKLFSCSTQLSMKIILLINVKMPTTVGIFKFTCRISDF